MAKCIRVWYCPSCRGQCCAAIRALNKQVGGFNFAPALLQLCAVIEKAQLMIFRFQHYLQLLLFLAFNILGVACCTERNPSLEIKYRPKKTKKDEKPQQHKQQHKEEEEEEPEMELRTYGEGSSTPPTRLDRRRSSQVTNLSCVSLKCQVPISSVSVCASRSSVRLGCAASATPACGRTTAVSVTSART